MERYIKCFGGDGFFSGTGSDQRNYFLGREIYIQKCISAYDEEATAARKLRLLEEKKARAFDQIYTPFIQNHPIRLKNGIWEGVDFSQGEECTSDDFFQLYHEMGE